MRNNLVRAYANGVIKKYHLIHPLDVSNFVSMLGFNVKFIDTGKSDAYTLIYKGKKLILLNKNSNSKGRINFTLAHELGHYFIPEHLDALYQCNVNEFMSSQNLNNTDVEREADLFASELLLPNKLYEKGCNVSNLEDIVRTSSRYSVSIPVAAIRMIENTYDAVCFMYFENSRIKWYISSESFKQQVELKDVKGSSIPKFSLLNDCIENGKISSEGKIPAFTWIDNIDDDMLVNEYVLNYIKYNSGYILINANELGNPYDDFLI